MKQLLKAACFAAIVCLLMTATANAQTVVSFNPPSNGITQRRTAIYN